MQTPLFILVEHELKWPENREQFPAPGDIHIWKAALSGNQARLDGYYAMLSDAEKTRADRLKVEVARERFISAHAILRKLLGKYIDQPPDGIEIEAATGGKPFLGGQSPIGGRALRFNLAHSGSWMLISVSRDFESGIDLETVDSRVDYEQVSTHFFSSTDITWLDLQQSAERNAKAFFRLWTCKEAVVKAEGSGMRLGLADVRIEFGEGEESARGFIGGENYNGRAWLIRTFEPEDGYTAALAYESLASAADSRNLLYFQWIG